MRELESTGVFSSEEKIMGLNEARRRILLWRKMGLSVGFTSGYFGVATAASVGLLRQAKQRCDRLIVGLCIDAPTGREAADPQDRSSVLASFASVDLVVPCDDTAAALIDELRPDIVIDSID
jgi:D-beta-D-heptose 7-phosphate kinase / D-beta-D-heptose 1-phosphate adenosyltransferase